MGMVTFVSVIGSIGGVGILAVVFTVVFLLKHSKPKAQAAEEPAEEAQEPVAEEAEEAAEEPAAEEPEEAEEAEDEAEEAEEEAEEAEETEEPEEEAGEAVPGEVAAAAEEPAAPVRPDLAGEVLAVKDMSPALQIALGVAGAEHAAEVYSVRYSYSFKARLVLASDETKNYFTELVSEIGSYKKMRRRESRRQQNISVSRQRVAILLFKGKKLSIAFALDPKEFEGTKFRGKDMSGMKRFAATPMLLKVDSPRRLKYAKALIARIAEEKGLKQNAAQAPAVEVPTMTRDELIEAKEIRVSCRKIEQNA